jgi:hypothetical protein
VTDIDTAALRAAADRPGHQVSALTVLALLDHIDAQAAEIERLRRENAELEAHAEYMGRMIPGVRQNLDDRDAEIERLRVERDSWRGMYGVAARRSEDPVFGPGESEDRSHAAAKAAVDRVRALHTPFCDQGCTDATCVLTVCSCGWDEYPCPTIRAIEGGA